MKKPINRTKIFKEAGVLLIAAVMLLSTVVTANTSNTNVKKPMPTGLDTFTEGFEDGAIPDGWLNFDNDSDGNLWEILQDPEFQPHSGEYSAGSTSLGGLSPDNWLIMPPLTISETSELSYWLSIEDSGSREDFEIFVSTTGNTVPDDFTDRLYSGIIPIYFWFEQTWDLSAYDGETIHIAFRHTHPLVGEVMSWIKIDDIAVTNVTLPVEPKLEIESISGGNGVTTIIKNTGDADATDMDISITIEGGLIIFAGEYEYPDAIAAGDKVEITMPVFGIGLGIFTPMPEITVSAECTEGSSANKTASGLVILFFVIGVS